MLITLIGEGRAETIYDGETISISDSINIEEMQKWADQWVSGISDDKVDKFGNLDPDKMTIEEVVENMPAHWGAHLVGEKSRAIFL